MSRKKISPLVHRIGEIQWTAGTKNRRQLLQPLLHRCIEKVLNDPFSKNRPIVQFSRDRTNGVFYIVAHSGPKKNYAICMAENELPIYRPHMPPDWLMALETMLLPASQVENITQDLDLIHADSGTKFRLIFANQRVR